MGRLRAEQVPAFNESVVGTWGEMRSPAGGVVPFVLTSARVSRPGGDAESDLEARLLHHLLPVREALPTLGVDDFEMLLQRPIDDHRVASLLIKYLTEPNPQGVPPFFPPILVAALPFHGSEPRDEYATVLPQADQPSDPLLDSFPWGRFRETQFGEEFRIRRLWSDDVDRAHPLALAQFSWAAERIKLVVLDGQHRAMAFLAIMRSLTGHWGEEGTKYRQFYEHVRIPHDDFDVENLRIPVTLVWFPPTEAGEQHPHRTARSIFVTVNNQARKVGDARLMMLNDSELVPIFTRFTLERARSEDAPDSLRILDAILFEDDDVSREIARSQRWNALTDYHILATAIGRLLFLSSSDQAGVSLYPGKWDLNSATSGEIFQTRLKTGNYFAELRDADGLLVFEEERLRNDQFPEEWLADDPNRGLGLRRLYQEGYGDALLWLFSYNGPFGDHLRALEHVKNVTWPRDDDGAKMAFQAVFEALGFWPTLRRFDAIEDGQQGNAAAAAAWTVIQQQKDRFESHRAALYAGYRPGDEVPEDVRRKVDRVFAIFKTEACQIGLVGAFCSLRRYLGVPDEHLAGFAKHFAESLALGLKGVSNDGSDRRWSLLPSDNDPTMNHLPRLSKSDALYFRCMWTLLLTPRDSFEYFSNFAHFGPQVDVAAQVERVISLSGKRYFTQLKKLREKELRNQGHRAPAAEAERIALGQLARGRGRLFDRPELLGEGVAITAVFPRGDEDDNHETEEDDT